MLSASMSPGPAQAPACGKPGKAAAAARRQSPGLSPPGARPRPSHESLADSDFKFDRADGPVPGVPGAPPPGAAILRLADHS